MSSKLRFDAAYIITVLDDLGPLTARQIAEASEIPVHRVRAALKDLQVNGFADWHTDWISQHAYVRVWKLLPQQAAPRDGGGRDGE